MQFASQQELSTACLVLRSLYDGDVIEWPIDSDHPLRAIFEALEQQGYIARWDRTWPRHDRYRLTERGIAEIERLYRPAGSEQLWNDIRARNLSPRDRRAYLQTQGYDPFLWPLLHDPSTHWSSYGAYRGRYYDYFWEDDYGFRYRHSDPYASYDTTPDQPLAPAAAAALAQYNLDLDREAHQDDALAGVAPASHDYDVS
jgi:hypothetical protein